MKINLWSLFILATFLLMSCGDDDPVDPEVFDQTIIGSWQLVEIYISPGGPTTWKPVENGYVMNYNDDLSFSNFNTCDAGTYTIVDNSLTINCTESSVIAGQEFEYTLEFENDDTIVLSNNGCIEPCQERFNRVD